MPLVSVARDKFAVAVGSPKYWPERHASAYERLELVDALERTYATDAHLVSYVLPPFDVAYQPRLSKHDSPRELVEQAVTTSIFVDVDNPRHAAWTDETRSRAIASYEHLPLPCGIYHTSKGARFVLILAEPVPSLIAEPLIRRALSIFDAAGFAVDHTAKDWTRHMRLPNVFRDGRPFRSPYLDFTRMRPVELEPLEVPTRQPRARSRREPLPPIPFTATLAEHWQARARVIGSAISSSVAAEYHRLYLAIAGALLAKQTPPEHVPELVRLVAIAARSSKPAHHEQSARDTVSRYLAGHAVTGMRDLVAHAPVVADAVHAALADAVQLSRPASAAPSRADVEVVTRALEQTIATAPDGLTVITAECGLGKTRAAQVVAATRASSRPATSSRAPLQTKTSISVDKNELAIQIAGDLAAQGIAVRRIFGPLSVVDADGRPVCRLHDRAAPLVAGGQSVREVLCLGRGRYRCPYYDECEAKEGFVDYVPPAVDLSSGPPRVTVGTHALIRELDASAGSTGLLVIDEPPQLLETLTLTRDDLQLTERNLASFQEYFELGMRPVVLAALDWLDSPELVWDDVTDTLERPPTEDATGKPLRTPPLRIDAIGACRTSATLSATLGKVSGVLRALHRAMTRGEALVRLDTEVEPPRIVVTAPREDLALALRREGAVVAMDANADLHLPAFTKVVGYAPPVHRFVAGDGAPIERKHLRCGSGNRKNWLSHGRLVLDTGLLSALRGVASWAEECAASLGRPVQLGIISIRVVELALRSAFGEDVFGEWTEAKQTARALATATTAISELFISPNIVRPVLLAHYGATRGLNRFAGVDCLATVGDPWPNLGDVQTEADFLGVDWNDRMEALASAELEQAHGRLRTVHRRVPGFALHVGQATPGGTGWSSVVPTALPNGRPAAGRPMPTAELQQLVAALGGLRSAARVVGCHHRSLQRYLDGRGVPPAVASTLRRLGGAETPIARRDL